MDKPLVSIVIPVYNGEKYLHECLESVLAQIYQNWDCTIINNCSTDRSLEIAENYAKKDSRITVYSNKCFVGLIENHNIAFRSISSNSKYCKLVSADDWIYPECISKMVYLAEHYPTIGIVGSYAINDYGIHWNGLPHQIEVFDGHHICRLFLLGLLGTFWLPTTVLYRSSLVTSKDVFFPGSAPSADLAACLACLRTSDFGFVHQILSFERIHNETMSARVYELGTDLLDRIDILKEFGPMFLRDDEFGERMEALLHDYYYNGLADACINYRNRNKEFWDLHRRRLRELGYKLYDRRLLRAICLKLLDLLLNPKQTIEKIVRRVKSKHTRKDLGRTDYEFSVLKAYHKR